MIRLIAVFSLVGTTASAQTYSTRTSDIRLDAEAVSSAILGHDLEFFDGGISRYSPGGSYSWTYGPNNGGTRWFGIHDIASDGTVCIDFHTLRSRCDMFVQSGERLVLLTEDGQPFPEREVR